MSVAGVVLAAGRSRRLERPKQALVLGGETLVERAVRVALQAGLAPVIVVANPESDFGVSLHQPGCTVVVNEQASEGMASSIRCGVNAAMLLQATGAVLMTCDQVAVQPEHLRQLAADPANLCGSSYAGKAGIPAYFPASSFRALLQLEGDSGARNLLRQARAVVCEELGFDIDTAEDAARAKAT